LPQFLRFGHSTSLRRSKGGRSRVRTPRTSISEEFVEYRDVPVPSSPPFPRPDGLANRQTSPVRDALHASASVTRTV
jgi:hypothetical protein